MTRFYFWAPATDMPTGGIANYFTLAQALRQLGYEAMVVSDRSLGTWWLPPDVEPWWSLKRDVTLTADDVVIGPEWWQVYAREIAPARLLPYCQAALEGVTFQGLTLALSQYCCEVARYQGGEPFLVERILTPFWQLPDETKRAGVLLLPLKNGWTYLDPVASALRDAGHEVTVADRNNTATQLRKLLWSHEAFVALSWPEGLDMISQEAMACGCLVAALGGYGRCDYLEHQVTGWMAPSGDWPDLVDGVRWLLEHPAVAETAARRIERYRPETAAAQIGALAQALIAGTD